MKQNIAFIPVRGGSKSIPHKNRKLFNGMPLVYWTAKAANDCQHIYKVVIATDDEALVKLVEGFNLDKLEVYWRSSKNAEDHSSTESVLLEYLESTKLDLNANLVLLQATSPFTTTSHITSAIEKMNDEGLDSIVSVVKNKRFYWNVDGTPENYDVYNRPRRQDFEGNFMENGAIYASKVGAILKSKNRISGTIGVYEMPEYTALELDDPEDWILGEYYMQRFGYKRNLPKVKLFATDVDGVLTDASMYYTTEGDVMKKFNTHDGMGLQIIRNTGVKTAIVTSEITEIVSKRAEKLGVDFLYQGKRHGGKLDAIKEMCVQMNINLNEVAYIGDDINCLEALEAVGLAACPANATPRIKALPGILQLDKKGGEGVVREFIELILGH